MRLKIFGDSIIDDKTKSQIRNCIGPEDIGVLTADAHYGYGHPIGGAVAYKNHISISGVGFDIACGNKAVRTDLMYKDIENDMSKIMDEVQARISFGMGRNNNEPVDHEIFDKIAYSEFAPQRELLMTS